VIKGLRLATIWSEDLTKKLLPFYRDVVGLKPGIEAPGFVLFGDPNAPALALGTHSEVHGNATDPARHMVGLEVDDIQAEYQRLKNAGVDFIQAPEKGPGDDSPVMATLRDPEGNLVQLFQYAGAM
jgi:predicted enzyme related to lactoylglutathione lyase